MEQQHIANRSKQTTFNTQLPKEKAKLVNVIDDECNLYCKLNNYYCKSLLETGDQVSLLSKDGTMLKPDLDPNPDPGTKKKQTHWKNLSSRTKTLPVVSCIMKDKVEVIHFHIQNRGVQSLIFVQIKFGKCTTNFHLQNTWYKNENCQFVALTSMDHFRKFTHFMQPHFQ